MSCIKIATSTLGQEAIINYQYFHAQNRVFTPEFKDNSPPNRISDLTSSNIDSAVDNNVLYLQWTAPGGDWNHGHGKNIFTLNE